ncbi:hypothetical protein SAMN05421770_102558 [Granulicella rosea]|uniref:Uncharacterized protein n=1 Tax=Granulicella rosea TaxID=474952 RepID=A0A239HTH2_9BACT|nr:hypothetical protein [Granulicella rosea]SNS84677.1 hypothetical protein SAMN05421770_102558 [Granulicella rosea]
MDQIQSPPTAAKSGASSLLVRILLTLAFLVLGYEFSLFALQHSPSFWYVPAAVLLFVGGFLWFWPAIAAAFSLPLTLALLLMMLTLGPWRWVANRGPGFSAILVLLAAAAVCVAQIRRHGVAQKALTTAVVLLIVALAVDRAFTNRVELRGFDMSWTADGVDPVGDPVEPNAKGEKPVLLFLKVGGGFCYDAIFSEDLRRMLNTEHKPLVHVVYNEFHTFGRATDYNVHSVEGMILNEGRKPVIANPDGYHGILLSGGDQADAPASCPQYP